MTIQDLIDICKDEERNPKDAHLMIDVGNVRFHVDTSDSQDPWHESHVMMTVRRFEDD